MKFNYEWNISDKYPASGIEKHGSTVFSCFSCGGGSSMGYKLAGYDVIGNNEIDPKMMKIYRENHKPEFSYLEPIQTFKLRKDLPDKLYNLDILDGSPPCSSFSMAGNREKDWGKEKKFREGQSEQILDRLFFDFLDLAELLKPKAIVAENVKGMLLGDAKAYVNEILIRFEQIGYFVDYKLLDASKMGVPQKRERVFFTAIREDIYKGGFTDLFGRQPLLDLHFTENEIKFKNVRDSKNYENKLSDFYTELWSQREDSDKDFSCINGRVRNKPNTGFGCTFVKSENVCGTLTSHKDCYCDFEEGRYLSELEWKRIGSFPKDYNFLDNQPQYVIGMSVPPVMMAQVSHRIYTEWLKPIHEWEGRL